MQIIRIAQIIISIGVCTLVFGETLKSPTEARALTEKVMVKVGEGDPEAGLRLVKPYLSIPPAEFEVTLGSLRMQMPAMAQRFGKSIGYEFISQDKVGENLLRIVYINRFETHVMRWSFYFYRGKSGWILDTFKTDDDIRQLFP